ncbi:hypothetical protein [Geopseudomonas aromaticivorans]
MNMNSSYRIHARGEAHSTAVPLALTLAAGQSLRDVADKVVKDFGDIEAYSLSIDAIYTAVKTKQGDVKAFVIPYEVDFAARPPREIHVGIHPESMNPRWSSAPAHILSRLTEPQDEASAEWRSKCWAHLHELNLSSRVWSRGDIIELKQPVPTDTGVKEPGIYVVRERLREFVSIQSIHGGAPEVVKGLGEAAQKIPLSNDPRRALEDVHGVASLKMIKVGGDSLTAQYVLLAETVSGEIRPVAKAEFNERESLLRRTEQAVQARHDMVSSFAALSKVPEALTIRVRRNGAESHEVEFNGYDGPKM